MIRTLSIFLIKDYIEIIFFSVLIYSTSRWLLYDHTKKLIPYFYCYIITLVGAHYYALPTITFFLLLTIPGILGLFVLMHQETLQKNLIGLKNITTATKEPHDWTEILMQTMLHNINRKKDMLCVIEKTESLHTFISAAFEINAPISSDLLAILCDSPSYNTHQILWISHQGLIKGINSSWNNTASTLPLLFEVTRLHSQTNDILFFHTQALSHQTTVIMNGVIEKNISSAQLHHIIKKHSLNNTRKGFSYAYKTKHNNTQKPSA